MHLEHHRCQVLYHSRTNQGEELEENVSWFCRKCFVMLGCPHGLELWCNSVKVNLNLSSKRRGKSKGVEKTKLYKSPPKKIFYSTSLVKKTFDFLLVSLSYSCRVSILSVPAGVLIQRLRTDAPLYLLERIHKICETDVPHLNRRKTRT